IIAKHDTGNPLLFAAKVDHVWSRTASRRAMMLCAALGVVIATPARAADPADILAGRSKDCPHCNLAGANLKRFPLTWAALAGATPAGGNRHRADLAGANLSGANLTHANLNKSGMKRAILAGARLGEAMLYEADLSGADLTRADLAGAMMGSCQLTFATL